jgi:hypothetical protein
MKSVYEDNKKKKQEIIEKAEALKDSNDWKEAGNKLIQLQKEWQKIGSAGKKAEHPLWLQFRSACDAFFNRKKEHFAAADLALDENLRKKEAFIAALAGMEITGTDEEKIERLNALGKEFKAMEDLSSRIQVDPTTRETTMFKARIAALSNQENSEYLLSKERGIIRDRINKINEEIIRIENNMAFFGNSKNASDMLKEYQEKIESLKKEIDTQKEKLKLFPKANKA